MAVGKQNPREPRDFYHLFRPNTVIWLGRILPLMPWAYFPARFLFDRLGIETNIDDVSGYNFAVYLAPFFLQFMLILGMMLPSSLKAGVFQYTKLEHMDEFELRLAEKARLFAYRFMGWGVLLSLPFLATEGPIAEFTGGANAPTLSIVILGLMISLSTLAPAYFHWSLKLVPPEENIRPDPPFMSDEDVAKGFWRR